MSIPMVDLPCLAELLVALLVVATLDGAPPPQTATEPPPTEPPPKEPETPEPLPGGWSAETDLHAQRLLRLEKLRDALPSQP